MPIKLLILKDMDGVERRAGREIYELLISGVSNFTSVKLNREHGLPDLHRVRSADSPVDGIGIFSSWPAFD